MADGFKYDVFISYSRKDYVRDGKPFEGNVVSKIMGLFDANGISYWIDKKGIYSGLEFMPEIAKAISSSMMMVFVSSANSNASKFTPGEVIEALNKDRTIIPIRIDATEYHDKFRIVLNSLDFIDYVKNPDAAMTDLLRSVYRVKEVYKKKEQESQKAALVQESIKSIKARTKKYQLLEIQQKTLLEDIIRSNIEIGHKTRICPICQEELPLEDAFCVNCGWHFHPLEQLCEGVDVLDETRLALSRSIWSNSSADMTSTVSSLKKQVKSLEGQLRRKDARLLSAVEEQDKLKLELMEAKANLELRLARGTTHRSLDYVDLGLPSGTLWRGTNESGFFTFDQAVVTFGKCLPSREQLTELKDSCKWSKVNGGYLVTGPNGNSIRFPGAGWRDEKGEVHSAGSYGSYWSSTSKNNSFAFGLGFEHYNVFINSVSRINGRSVRLVAPVD